jgi:hypothetical protein
MTGREIRSMLRGATAAKLIWGWQRVGGEWHIVTNDGKVSAFDHERIETYVRGLYMLDVQPVFRTSEPRNIDALETA